MCVRAQQPQAESLQKTNGDELLRPIPRMGHAEISHVNIVVQALMALTVLGDDAPNRATPVSRADDGHLALASHFSIEKAMKCDPNATQALRSTIN